jgi:predicted ribosome quality control (RQC) complex YloA/Tae2 family protein
VTLTGFDGAPVELALDPSLSPRENAEALYREAARLEKARARIPPLLERARGRMEELERLRDGVAAGTVAAQEAAVRLPEERAGGASAHGSVGPRLPYRAYRSSGGLEIRVGRGPADNDQLTFRHARPQDVWLHARDVAGAHVILRWEGPGNPPARDLQEAAVLAALGSRARSSGTVPVDWTLRKHVRKPRKAPPGAVVPERVQTLFVRPDPELPERLRGEDQSR